MKNTAGIIVIITFILIAFWLVWENLTVVIKRYTVSSDRLPSSFDNFRIAQVSDLHDSRTAIEWFHLADRIKEQSPDIIVITGDLTDSSKNTEYLSETLIKFSEIAPTYYVTGNHEAEISDYYGTVEKMLLECNIHVLHNEKVYLERNGESICIAGIDDPKFAGASYDSMGYISFQLDSLDTADAYTILLSHRPEAFEIYAEKNIDIVLSGHAHGGQINLPFIGGLIAPNQGFFPEYDAGLFTRNNTSMVLSRGLGHSFIPVRINNRRELVIVDISSSK